jgi:hypothetical protein
MAAYQAGVATAKKGAVESFAPHFFNNMVLSLEIHFVHRTRGKEGKDGNALNEVRMLANSLMNNGGVLAADKTIKYDAAKSVLGYNIGDEIKVDETGFTRLATAFFAEIEKKFL